MSLRLRRGPGGVLHQAAQCRGESVPQMQTTKTNPMKNKPQQKEITWGAPEDFALVPENSTDWDRVQREREAYEKAVRESQSKQLDIFSK
jgi:hypothetical protein